MRPRVVASVSHDLGATFSTGVDISGSAPFCVGLASPNTCDQTWGNAPAVAPNGTIVVAFQDTCQYAPDGSTNHGRNTGRTVCFTGRCGHGQNTYFAAMP